MKVLRTTGPSYNTNDPMPVRYYKWKCPRCGDICEDPENIHESMCHNEHEVKLQLVHDGGVHVSMVAEYVVPEFRPVWNTHNYHSEGGHKIHLIQEDHEKRNRKRELLALCGRTMGMAETGEDCYEPVAFEKWVATGEREVCILCLRRARKIMK